MIRSLSTWLWLVDLQGGSALDASAEQTSDLAAGLFGHFSDVTILRENHASLEAVRLDSLEGPAAAASFLVGSIATVPLAPRSFECIALHDALASVSSSKAELRTGFAAAYALLRHDGWLAATFPSPSIQSICSRQWRPSRRSVCRMLTRAGFREMRLLYVESGLERPLTMLPGRADAIRAYENAPGMRPRTRGVRSALASVGAHSILYPAFLVLARA